MGWTFASFGDGLRLLALVLRSIKSELFHKYSYLIMIPNGCSIPSWEIDNYVVPERQGNNKKMIMIGEGNLLFSIETSFHSQPKMHTFHELILSLYIKFPNERGWKIVVFKFFFFDWNWSDHAIPFFPHFLCCVT